jgi:hypothetical protein
MHSEEKKIKAQQQQNAKNRTFEFPIGNGNLCFFVSLFVICVKTIGIEKKY